MKLNDTSLHKLLIDKLKEDYFGGKRLCDVRIVCRKKEFHAHSFVLTSLSKFFEEEIVCQKSRNVSLDLDVDILETVLDFCYTSEIDVDAANVGKVLSAAESLGVELAQKMCLDYLINYKLCEQTCFQMFTISQTVTRFRDVARACVEFIGQNFKALLATEKFVQLKFDVLRALFELMFDDRLAYGFVVPHLFRFKAVKNWVSHDYEARGERGDRLLEFVDFKRINHALLKRMLDSEKFLMKCKKTKKRVYAMVSSNAKKEADAESCEEKKLVVLNADGQRHSMVEFCLAGKTFDVLKKDVLRFESTANVLSAQTGCFFYAVRGSYLRRVRIVEDLHCQTFALKRKISAYGAGGLVGNKLYAHGGIKDVKEFRMTLDGGMTAIDLARNFSVEAREENRFPRFDHACAVHDKKLFFTGGRLPGGEVTDTCFVYDTATGKYDAVAPLTTARCRHQTAVLGERERLVVVGGVDANGNLLRSVEVFEIGSGAWRRVECAINDPTVEMCAVEAEGKVWVVGESQVECWDGDEEDGFEVVCEHNLKLSKSCCYVATSNG